MLVIGLPAYWALEKVGLVRWWTLSAVGALAALPIFANSAPFRTAMMAVAAGAAVGATAYFLLPRNQRHGNHHEGGNDA
jgi:zinc transporter ZupT